LQVAREGARLQIEFAIRNRLAHADEGSALAKLFDARLDEIAERAGRASVNLGWHALGIGLEPYPFHAIPVANASRASNASREYRTEHAIVDRGARKHLDGPKGRGDRRPSQAAKRSGRLNAD
jgi:hypothetical protein